MRRIAEQLADGFFGAKIEGHQDLNGDAAAAMVEFLDADNFAEGFLIDGAWGVGVGKGDEEAEALFIARVFGDEVDAVESGVLGWEDFVEIGDAGLGRAHANDTWNFQPAFAAALCCSQARHDPFCTQERAASQVQSGREVLESSSVVRSEHGAAADRKVFVTFGD